jgi:hypothetical protein
MRQWQSTATCEGERHFALLAASSPQPPCLFVGAPPLIAYHCNDLCCSNQSGLLDSEQSSHFGVQRRPHQELIETLTTSGVDPAVAAGCAETHWHTISLKAVLTACQSAEPRSLSNHRVELGLARSPCAEPPPPPHLVPARQPLRHRGVQEDDERLRADQSAHAARVQHQ